MDKQATVVCYCSCCAHKLYVEQEPEPLQQVLCEQCWDDEGKQAAQDGHYAQAW